MPRRSLGEAQAEPDEAGQFENSDILQIIHQSQPTDCFRIMV
jgi:hypothetical protein